VVHLTVSGITYDRTYWNFPYKPSIYSYVGHIINQSNSKIVVLKFDRLGIGLSDHPPANETNFDKIIAVAQSTGTLISWIATLNLSYNEYINGLIATGWLHVHDPVGYVAVSESSYPVQSDPKFSSDSYPDGYLTTNPNIHTRQELFYNIDDVDS
ncbi:unnamed protein product, partial [Didymodactylos carnosus]